MYIFDKQSKSLLKNQSVIIKEKPRKKNEKPKFSFKDFIAKITNILAFEKKQQKIKINKSELLVAQETVEIKNDSILKFLIRVFKLSIVVFVFILIWLGFEKTKNYVLKSERFLIKKVNITGCDIISESNIRKLYLEYCNSKGLSQQSNIFVFNINELHQFILERCNAIETMYISKNFDYSLGINIIEKKPIGMIYNDKEKKLQLIDNKLNLFDIQDQKIPNYIILSDSVNELITSAGINKNLVKLVKIVNSINRKTKQGISEIEYVNDDDVFLIYLNNGVKLLCHLENYISKLEKIELILSSFQDKKIEYIDLRFKHIYLKEKKTEGKNA